MELDRRPAKKQLERGKIAVGVGGVIDENSGCDDRRRRSQNVGH